MPSGRGVWSGWVGQLALQPLGSGQLWLDDRLFSNANQQRLINARASLRERYIAALHGNWEEAANYARAIDEVEALMDIACRGKVARWWAMFAWDLTANATLLQKEKRKHLRVESFFFQGARNSETICIAIACSTDGQCNRSKLAWTLQHNVWQAIWNSLPGWDVTIQLMHPCIGLQVIRSPVGTWNDTEKTSKVS